MCRYEKAPDGSKYWLPDCMGGAVYGEQGCTCTREPKKSKLEKKVEELEKRIALLEGAKNTEQANQPDNGYCNPETGEPFRYTPLQVN